MEDSVYSKSETATTAEGELPAASNSRQRKRKAIAEDFEPRRSVRESKKVETYRPPPINKEPKTVVRQEGEGDTLGSIAALDVQLNRLPSDYPLLIAFHRLIYKVSGTKPQRKALLRQWRGVVENVREEELARITKGLEKMKMNEKLELAKICGLAKIQKGELPSQLAAFLVKPDGGLCKEGAGGGKRRRISSKSTPPAATKKGKTKRATTSDKECPAGFNAFSEKRLAELRDEEPDTEEAELESKIKGEWDELSVSAKAKFGGKDTAVPSKKKGAKGEGKSSSKSLGFAGESDKAEESEGEDEDEEEEEAESEGDGNEEAKNEIHKEAEDENVDNAPEDEEEVEGSGNNDVGSEKQETEDAKDGDEGLKSQEGKTEEEASAIESPCTSKEDEDQEAVEEEERGDDTDGQDELKNLVATENLQNGDVDDEEMDESETLVGEKEGEEMASDNGVAGEEEATAGEEEAEAGHTDVEMGD